MGMEAGEEEIMNEKWFKENHHWLKGWLDTAQPIDKYEGMQIFKNLSIKEHKHDVLFACVFGLDSNAYREGSDFNNKVSGGLSLWAKKRPIRYMKSFVEQMGCRPTPNDKVQIQYLAGNGITRWMQKNKWGKKYIYLSECKLRIL